MAEQKKIIEGLEMSYKYSNVDENNTLVPQRLVLDAIEALKEQEPQSVIVHEEPRNGNILWFADCPKCKHGIERDKHRRFCGFCGQAVKWDG